MAERKIKNTEVHLDYDAGSVIKTKEVVDVNGGMNPVYYIKKGSFLEVSSSVYSLIRKNGGLIRNYDFDPPNWCNEEEEKKVEFLRYPMKLIKESKTKYKTSQKRWYPCWQTIDKRIFKLRPHESVTLDGSEINFDPKNKISHKEKVACEAANKIIKFINKIEKRFPKAEQIVLTGGKDSQIIHTVPKKDASKWHYLTSEPNFEEVKDWVGDNDINVNRSYRVDCVNREDTSLLRKKIVASDLYSSIKHIRWVEDLKKISDEESNKVIYWAGTEGDTFFSYNNEYNNGSREKFWRMHNFRAPSWQGNFHQTIFNVTNSPVMSPYHSEEMWKFLSLFDPKTIKKGEDIREKVAHKINEDINIKDLKESPDPYKYEGGLNTKCIYLDEIKIK